MQVEWWSSRAVANRASCLLAASGRLDLEIIRQRGLLPPSLISLFSRRPSSLHVSTTSIQVTHFHSLALLLIGTFKVYGPNLA